MNICIKKGQRGFSLVETLVAITILLIAVLAPMRIASQSIKSAGFAREQLTAVFLAQEGIEMIVRARDADALNGGSTWSWYTSLLAACKNSGQGCSYNPTNGAFVSCATIATCRLYLDTTGGTSGVYYTHTQGALPASPYTRVVKVLQGETLGVNEVNVQSVVSWYSTMFATTTSVTLRTRILDQYED